MIKSKIDNTHSEHRQTFCSYSLIFRPALSFVPASFQLAAGSSHMQAVIDGTHGAEEGGRVCTARARFTTWSVRRRRERSHEFVVVVPKNSSNRRASGRAAVHCRCSEVMQLNGLLSSTPHDCVDHHENCQPARCCALITSEAAHADMAHKPPPLNAAPYRNRRLILNVIRTGNKVRDPLKTQRHIFTRRILPNLQIPARRTVSFQQ